ncbi:MAG: hypothetical protein IJ597_01915 [Synergistaceae bacterium]|nr:hypothetical protein [Synergistaceae bacterium]
MKTKTVLLFLFSLSVMLFGGATVEIKNPEVGDIVTFGKFNGSDLSWLVLDVDEKIIALCSSHKIAWLNENFPTLAKTIGQPVASGLT